MVGGVPGAPMTLRALLDTLDQAVADEAELPAGDEVSLSSAGLLEPADLPDPRPPQIAILTGAAATDLRRWLDRLATTSPEQRPVVVLTKLPATPALRRRARSARVALVTVDARARWDHVLSLIRARLERSQRPVGVGDEPAPAVGELDLAGLAQVVADRSRGMVTIEDLDSRVLAYSPSDEYADELRILSILGREGPPDYLRELRHAGVFDRLRDTDEVVEVPAFASLGTRRRLAIGIRHRLPGDPVPRRLGTVWVQQGGSPLADTTGEALRGAAAIAGRILARTVSAPTADGVLIGRLLGGMLPGIDPLPDATVAAAELGVPADGPAAVIGFAPLAATTGEPTAVAATVDPLLRLHASAFRSDALLGRIGDRCYAVLPGYRSAAGVNSWVRSVIAEFDQTGGPALRAAIALPVAGLGAVATARAEVDRVLEATGAGAPSDGDVERVTTLSRSLTPVLLAEALDAVAGTGALTDPRLTRLADYDRQHDAALRSSAQAFLGANGDVRRAAARLGIHPNTLRYRLSRIEQIVGIDLSDHADRLLLDLQLTAQHRHPTDS